LGATTAGQPPQQAELAVEQRARLRALDPPAPPHGQIERTPDLPRAAMRHVPETPRVPAMAATPLGEGWHDPPGVAPAPGGGAWGGGLRGNSPEAARPGGAAHNQDPARGHMHPTWPPGAFIWGENPPLPPPPSAGRRPPRPTRARPVTNALAGARGLFHRRSS